LEFLQVVVDNIIHTLSLWYHLLYLYKILGSDHDDLRAILLVSWMSLMSSMLLLTWWVHRRSMNWSHSFQPLSSLILFSDAIGNENKKERCREV